VKYLLDTCVVSELTKPHPSKNLVEWLAGVPSERLFLCSLTIGEIRKGVAKLPNSKKKARISEWVNSLFDDYRERILPVDTVAAESWGEVQGTAERQGVVISTIDGLLAAVARTNNLVLVTRNERDYVHRNVPVVNPWKASGSQGVNR